MRAALVRIVAHGVPLLSAWIVVRLVRDELYRPDGYLGLAIWILQAIPIALVTSMMVQRLSRKLLPLAFLLDQSLVFPDAAPSRFGSALRAGSLGRVHERVEELQTASGDHSENEAAIAALELVAALSRHDRLTRGHTERVRAHADLIAEEMGLPDVDRQKLAWGVLLHDVGKLAVPEAILNKKTALTEAEWATLQAHPVEGERIMAPLMKWLGDWGRAAADHHERWDGAGYPYGLSGQEISLAGRITAVADAFDVITTARSYKKPIDPRAARQELVRCAGEQFDPVVVRAMISVSLTRRRSLGPFMWLLELPGVSSFGSVVSGAPAAVAAASVAIAATAVSIAGVQQAPPESIGFQDVGRDDTSLVVVATPESPSISTAPTPPTTVVDVVSSSIPGSTPQTTANIVSTTANTLIATSSTVPAITTTTTWPSTPTTARATTTPTTIPPTTTTTTSTTTTTTTAPQGQLLSRVYLTNPGSADTESAPVLPLALLGVPTPQLRNFDTERNEEPGLTIKKDGKGLSSSDPTKSQVWELTLGDDATLNGAMSLTVYVAVDDADSDKFMGVAASLEVCDPTCAVVGTGEWQGSQTASFSSATLSLGSIDRAVPAGSSIRLKLVVPDWRSDDDLLVAFDAEDQQSQLRIN